jgi:hypothetical protein
MKLIFYRLLCVAESQRRLMVHPDSVRPTGATLREPRFANDPDVCVLPSGAPLRERRAEESARQNETDSLRPQHADQTCLFEAKKSKKINPKNHACFSSKHTE